ncbi:MAG: ADP-ribosylglycohydrolase [Subtercola sp.]|nr:ADP-ribosylglycohydrolase [Subtercola sp.]
MQLDTVYAERVYAGVLGKFIGVYLGRPVEGWAYDDIRTSYGLVDRYVNESLNLPLIVADDDISGTFTFGRSVEDFADRTIDAVDVGQTWLNYIIEDRTILWWGGYGRSTEHTAFLNLANGIPAPLSGSIKTNGRTLAEQIGAQIFSDAFGLMHPGDPASAAKLTRAAASVSHDGVALDAAAFFAAMRAQAFLCSDLDELTDIGLTYVSDPRLRQLVAAVTDHVQVGDDWKKTREWVDDQYGYHLYPGPCHSLSNTAMVLASLRVAGDDFGRAVAIASSVGFDTDSNAGTVGCLNGVRLGIRAIEAATELREPVADRAIIVSADGGEAITDASREAMRIVNSARTLRQLPPQVSAARFDFAFPGSRHGFTACPHLRSDSEVRISNPVGHALRIDVEKDAVVSVSTPTFLDPLDRISNFSTVASPTLYPGQTVDVCVSSNVPTSIRLYALYEHGQVVEHRYSPATAISALHTISWLIPSVGNLVPFRLGVEISAAEADAAVEVDSVDWRGAPSHFEQSGILLSSIWDTKPSGLAPWVSSARNWEADFGSTYCVSHPGDGGVVTIGSREWVDYTVSTTMTLSLHRSAGLVVRARGHRNYLAGIFAQGGILLIDQIDAERRVLARVPYDPPLDLPLAVELVCIGDELSMSVGGERLVNARTTRNEGGGAGFIVEGGTFTADGFSVRRYDSDDHQKQRKATQ